MIADRRNFINICELVEIIECIKAGNYPADFNTNSDCLEIYLHKKYTVLLKSDMDDISWEQHLGI
jgi:hypothetical protein